MERNMNAEQLSVALLAIEDRMMWDAAATFRAATELEHRAAELGDESLVVRARLCRTNMRLRMGELAVADREIHEIYAWAVEHGDRMLLARAHLVWANIDRLLGDAAKSLEHSLSSVELLDDTATAHMQVWHVTKLADALGFAASMDDARVRYAQAMEIAQALNEPWLHMQVFNNHAYLEHITGNPERAHEVSQRLLSHAEEHGFEVDAAILDTVAAIHIANGRYAEAEQTMELCLARHETGERDDADALAEYLLTLAQAQRGLGDTELAQQSLDSSEAEAVQRGLHEVLVRIRRERAELHAARGEYAEAFAMHKQFFEAHEQLHSQQQEAQARTRQAMFETAEAREEAKRFREQARRDALTGLRNRRYVDEELPALIASDPRLAVAIVDLDHFKRINDQLSHDVGDQVLVQVAKILDTELSAFCPDGFVARLGGEEFLLALPHTPPAVAVAQLETVRRAVGSYSWAGISQGLPVTVSIGVAGVCEAAHRTQPGVLSTADRNLYVAKRAGRDRVVGGTAGEEPALAYSARAA
ncbi:tetratricopeptide repeat-containing diguanylate cyclase [Couchioplanes caeruleus]|nr:tetratricopeptide repeat-containing diguanylate cyclase [Couchioplanes caeruleus]ROP30830.1 diguanylate cyclase (GGDEF)-like protein [Couchioplanes caeruleus]